MKRWFRRKKKSAVAQESKLAHRYLDGLKGCEIGASAHNPFNIAGCVFVDFTDDMATVFKEEERKFAGRAQHVDVVGFAWDLPFEDESLDYVLSSHVLEHCFDVIGTIEEWFRVIRPNGFVFMIVPHKARTFDKDRARTSLQELLDRHSGKIPTPPFQCDDHPSVWVTEDLLTLVRHMGWKLVDWQDVDDKVGNGFTIVLRK